MSMMVCVPAFAAKKSIENYVPVITASQTKKILQKAGYSKEEIKTLVYLEDTTLKNNATIKSSIVQSERPSNPQEGDTYTKVIYVSKSTINNLGSGAFAIAAGLILKAGVPAATAGLMGKYLADLIADNTSWKGVNIIQHYRYGETDEGTMGWTMGLVEWEVVY